LSHSKGAGILLRPTDAPTTTRSIIDQLPSDNSLTLVNRSYLTPLLLVVVPALSTAAGCRSAGAARPPTPTPTLPAVAESTAPSEGGVPSQAFDVVFMTFIPANYVAAPWMHPQSYAGINAHRLVFSGDDRSYDVDASRYRARQQVTIVADGAADPDGLVEGTKQNLGGRTESFVSAQALADGRIDDDDRDEVLGDARKKHAEVAVDPSGMIIDEPVRLGPRRVSVRLRTSDKGGPRDQLIAGAPSIDWDLTLVIDTSGPKPTYELTGTWDGYPACELYVNRKPILLRSPGAEPASFTDLLKLGPKIADEKIDLRGTLD
jgi:hypothetical protein